MGMHSSYTTEIGEKIAERIVNGESLVKICRDEGMPCYATVRKWENDSPEFAAISARAKELGCDFMADDCIEIADNPEIRADDKRIRVDTRLRLIGMWSKRYNPKLDLNHGNQPGNPLTILLQQISGTSIQPIADDDEG